MQLGARGVLDLMNSMGGLTSASKFWSAGDKVVYIFPVDLSRVEQGGEPVIPVAFKYGHNVDLGDGFKRSFIPTKSVLDEASITVKEPDFAYQAAGIFRALLEAEKERRLEIAKENSPNETAFKVEQKSIEDDFKDKYPAVGSLTVRAYTEVAVGKLDINGNFVNGEVKLDYGSLQLSKKKLSQLVQKFAEPNAYINGKPYFYIVMQTLSGDKKQAGQVDWNAVTDNTKKLEVLHPDFEEKITQLFSTKNPTQETIGAKVYDFRDYNEDEFKSAVANYVSDRTYMLKNKTGEWREIVRKQHNVDILNKIGLVAESAEIAKYLKKENDATPVEAEANTAQTLDIPGLNEE